MRRILLNSTLLFVVFLFLTTCEKGPQSLDEWGDPDNPPEEQPEIRGESLKLSATIAPYLINSRVSLDGSLLTWDEDEQFGLFERVGIRNTNTNIPFTLDSGEGSATGEFEGFATLENPWSKSDRTLYFYYPYSPTARDYEGVTFSLSQSQEQDPLSPEDHLSQGTGLVGKLALTSSQSNSNLSLDFTSIYSIYQIEVHNEAEESFDLLGVVIRSGDGEKIFPIRATYNLEEGSYTPTSTGKVSNIAIALKDGEEITLAPGESYKLSLLTFPIEIAAGSTIAYEVYTSAKNVVKEVELSEAISLEANSSLLSEVTIEDEDIAFTGEVLPDDTNCHLINPPTVPGKVYTFQMPITRANIFWGTTAYADPNNMIGPDTKWVADIIWKDVDIQDVIELTLSGVTGIGTDDMIEFSVGYKEEFPYGNAVIGVRKADENYDPIGDYLWSWHIWISDYAGQTHDVSVGPKPQLIMDRNLGARSNIIADPRSVGLLYQWGRKDPFVGGTYEYWSQTSASNVVMTTVPSGWDGNRTSALEGGTIPWTVQHPMSFVKCEDNPKYQNSHWMLTNTTAGIWEADYKTIYDPCPKGFKLPENASRVNVEDNGHNSAFAALDTDNFPLYPADSPRGRLMAPDIWFPTTGYLGSGAGTINNVRVYSYVTSVTRSSEGSGDTQKLYQRCLPIKANEEDFPSYSLGYNRGTGVAVRCIKWEADN